MVRRDAAAGRVSPLESPKSYSRKGNKSMASAAGSPTSTAPPSPSSSISSSSSSSSLSGLSSSSNSSSTPKNLHNKDERATMETQGQTPTPAYILKYAPYVDNFNWLMVFPLYALAPTLFALQCYHNYWLPWQAMVVLPFYGYARNIVCFGLMHRFFSHRAWQCSRPTTFILGCMATLIGNRGPLWWSSKHMRHHKYCENEGEYPHNDPHSHFRYGWWYGYIGWTMAPTEKRVDWDFVLPCFKTWEMALVEALTWVVPVAEAGLYWYLVNMHFAMWHVYSSSLWIYITLCINSLTHYDGTPEPEPVNGRHKCKATNKPPLIMRYSLDFMGEMSHADHHRYPRKALRPSYVGLDVMYWAFIRPLEALGVFWDVKGGTKAAELHSQ